MPRRPSPPPPEGPQPEADDDSSSTAMLVTHCYGILMTAIPATIALADEKGILLTEDALHVIEDTAVSCLIQSAISLATGRCYQAYGIDFAKVDALEAGRLYVQVAQCPEFREAMEERRRAAQAAEGNAAGESDK